MRKLLIAIFTLTSLYACHHDDSNEQEQEHKARRTVLVYMAAENNLASFATSDLNEMQTGSKSLTDDQNLIVYVDKANSMNAPFIARVKNGVLTDSVFMPEGLAADPTVLESVIRYTRQHFPARSYGLVLWGHASGWIVSNSDSISLAQSRAYGGSTGDNTSTSSGRYWMNIVPMAKAISNGMENEKLKFVFGDCCNFVCIETAYELRNATEYVLGSSAEIPDAGAPFDVVVPDLFKEDDRFYEDVLNHYYNHYVTAYKDQPHTYYNIKSGDLAGYSVPLAAVKTDELPNLASATARILGTIADKVNVPGSLDLTGVTYYGYISGRKHAYDMKAVLERNAAASDYQVWVSSYDKAVPFGLHSQKWMTNSSLLALDMDDFDADQEQWGLVSMFFPSSYYDKTVPNWNDAIQTYAWNEVIRWEQYGW